MAHDIEVKSLQQIPMFRDVDMGKLRLLAFASQRISCRQGETLCRQGEASDSAYIVLEGSVDVIREGAAGRTLLATLGAGQLIGELGVLCERPRNATIVASTDVEVLRIEKMVFLEFVRELPQLALAIIRELGKRLENMNEQLSRQARPA